MSVNQSSPGLLHELTEMSQKIAGIYGDFLDKVILYGSYSRGEQTDESDVDIAMLVKPGCTEGMHDKLLDLVVEYLEPKNSKGEDNKAFNNPMHTEKAEDFTMLDIKKELKERIRTKNKMLIGFDL